MLTVENPHNPFHADIKYGVPDGGEIDLHGHATYGEDRGIWFELKTSDGTALHINIRMGQNMQNIIVVNSYHHGKWGHEDKHFSHVNPDGPLRIHLEAHHKHFLVDINGGQFEFHHRLKKADVNRIEIRGDVRVDKLQFTNMDNHVELPHGHHHHHHH
ncbi:Galectin [Aphelenchoides bicaudatus]|nr:Galectin [Aphelenchoides bicaudatus]